PTEFLQLVDSNRIVSTTLNYSPNSPLYEITGTYLKGDSAGEKTVSPFITKMPLQDKELDRLESLPNVEIKERSTVVFSVIATFLPLVLGLIFVVAVIFIIVRLVATAKSVAPRAPPIHPPPVQSTQVIRQCPKCGAALKPDAPEGLCPACLLQHGI